MSFITLVVLCCALGYARAEGSDVVILTSANFDQIVKGTEFVLVEFFAPWCGHCKQLAPEYEKAATALREYGNLKLASVDATVEQSVASGYGIKGYPTLKFFKNGVASEYNGGRTAPKIISWLLKAIGAPLKTLTSADELTAYNADKPASVIGFFEKDSAQAEAFQKAAAIETEAQFAVVNDAAVAKALSVPFPSVVVFKTTEANAVYEGDFTAEAIAAFVGVERIPLVIPFTMEAAQEIFQSKTGRVAFLFTKDPNPAFRELAEQYRGKFVFSTSDGSVTRLNDHVGISASELPKFLVLTTNQQMRRYPLDGEATLESMKQHIDAFLAGTIAPVLKSDAAPASNDDAVKVVVGTTFDSIVMDPTKNVLLEVYAPWCGHCKTLAPIYEQLAEAVENVPNLVIAKMDGTTNEVDGVSVRGFPTLKFYPAGPNKSRAGEDYSGGRDLDALKSFVLSKSPVSASAAKEDL